MSSNGKVYQWICQDCAKKMSSKQFQYSTWHEGTCDVCGDKKVVTEPRDFFLSDYAICRWLKAEEQSKSTHGENRVGRD